MARLVFLDFPKDEVGFLKSAAEQMEITNQCEFYLSEDVEKAVTEIKSVKMGATGPDIVFLNGDSEYLLARIRNFKDDPKSRKNPLVVLGYNADSAFVEELYNLGINSFVGKPNSFSEMVRIAQIVLTYWQRVTQLPSSIIE